MSITARLSSFWFVLLGTVLVSSTATATTFTVTSTADNLNAGQGCTLREAVKAANQDSFNADCASSAGSGLDQILLSAGKTYSITGAPLVITQGLTIASKSANQLTTIRGRAGDATLAVSGTNVELYLYDVTLRHGSATGNSPGLVVGPQTFVYLRRSVLKQNSVGALVQDMGTLDLLESSVHDNDHGSNDGGGIASVGSASILHIEKTSIYKNVARRGAGIFSSGNLELRDSTLAQNSAGLSGGGIYTAATAVQIDMKGGTITRNKASSGAGVTVGGGSILWNYSIVAGNFGASGQVGFDCVNVFPDAEAYDSIFGDTCNPGGDRDVITADPELASQTSKRYPERIGFRPASVEALPVNRGGWEVDSDTDQYGRPRRFVSGDYEDGVDIGALELE